MCVEPYHVSGAFLSPCIYQYILIFKTSLCSNHWCLHFEDEETKAKGRRDKKQRQWFHRRLLKVWLASRIEARSHGYNESRAKGELFGTDELGACLYAQEGGFNRKQAMEDTKEREAVLFGTRAGKKWGSQYMGGEQGYPVLSHSKTKRTHLDQIPFLGLCLFIENVS